MHVVHAKCMYVYVSAGNTHTHEIKSNKSFLNSNIGLRKYRGFTGSALIWAPPVVSFLGELSMFWRVFTAV